MRRGFMRTWTEKEKGGTKVCNSLEKRSVRLPALKGEGGGSLLYKGEIESDRIQHAKKKKVATKIRKKKDLCSVL